MKLLTMLAMLGSLNTFAAGGTVENGGDVVYCRDHSAAEPGDGPGIPWVPDLPEGKLYTLDYAMGLVKGLSPSYYAPVGSWEQSRYRLLAILNSVSKNLRDSFRDFAVSTDQIDRHDATALTRRWEVWEGGMFFAEHKKIKLVPANCLYRKRIAVDGTVVTVHVMGYERVIRRAREDFGITYRYYPRAIAKLRETSELQYSFILTHEWLWDLTRDIEVNRAVNRFLHSREIERMRPPQIRRQLRRLGLWFI